MKRYKGQSIIGIKGKCHIGETIEIILSQGTILDLIIESIENFSLASKSASAKEAKAYTARNRWKYIIRWSPERKKGEIIDARPP